MKLTLADIVGVLAGEMETIADQLSAPEGAFQSNAGMGDRVIVEVIRPEDQHDESKLA